MAIYMPDTNVWVGVGKDAGITGRFEKAHANGDQFLIAPPSLIELVRGMVKYGKDKFSDDQKTFDWVQKSNCTILELPRPSWRRLSTRD
jgi:hypothetical protein